MSKNPYAIVKNSCRNILRGFLFPLNFNQNSFSLILSFRFLRIPSRDSLTILLRIVLKLSSIQSKLLWPYSSRSIDGKKCEVSSHKNPFLNSRNIECYRQGILPIFAQLGTLFFGCFPNLRTLKRFRSRNLSRNLRLHFMLHFQSSFPIFISLNFPYDKYFECVPEPNGNQL